MKLTVADLEILQFRTLKLEIFKLRIANSKYRKYRATLSSLLDRDLWKYKWKVRGLAKVKVLKSDRTVENGIGRLNHPSESFLHIFKGAALSRGRKYRRKVSKKQVIEAMRAAAYSCMHI